MRALLTLALVLVLAAPVRAQECVPTTSHPESTAGRWYIDIDCTLGVPGCEIVCWLAPVPPACVIWIYEESNGIEGLQRGDEYVDDTCGGAIESDTIVW